MAQSPNRLNTLPAKSREFASQVDLPTFSLPDDRLLGIVRLRVAQIGEMELGIECDSRDLSVLVEGETRLQVLEDWPMSLAFTSRERVAPGLTEILARTGPEKSPALPHPLRQAQLHFSKGRTRSNCHRH